MRAGRCLWEVNDHFDHFDALMSPVLVAQSQSAQFKYFVGERSITVEATSACHLPLMQVLWIYQIQ